MQEDRPWVGLQKAVPTDDRTRKPPRAPPRPLPLKLSPPSGEREAESALSSCTLYLGLYLYPQNLNNEKREALTHEGRPQHPAPPGPRAPTLVLKHWNTFRRMSDSALASTSSRGACAATCP